MALLSLIFALFLASGPDAEGRDASPGSTQRWDETLAKVDLERDPVARARARVEALYGAGDLPGALAEAWAGLSVAPEDLSLLRRACQLEVSLRDPGRGGEHVTRLARALERSSLGGTDRSWWEAEVAALTRDVGELLDHERETDAAIARARGVSFAILGIVILSLLGLALAGRRPRAETRPPVPG